MSYYHPYNTKNKYIFDWRSFDHKDFDDISNILNEELKMNAGLREDLEEYFEIKKVNKKVNKKYVKIISGCRECPNCYYYDVTDEEIKPHWICKLTFESLDYELEGFGEECPLEEVKE